MVAIRVVAGGKHTLKQPFDQLESIDVCEPKKPVPNLVRRRGTAEKTSPAPELWDFGAAVPEVYLSAEDRAAIFAHEVANSLTAISCSLQFVRTELDAHRIDDPILTKVVHGALAEIDSVGLLLHEYCAQVVAQPAAWKLTDVAILVDDVLALQAVVCRAAGVVVNFERGCALPWVRLDPLKIKQVITNLCKNAKEAMPLGGQLTLKVFRVERTVVLEVRDSGVGMPEGVEVFELYKSTKKGGHGVGLSLAREIVAAHRGTIAFTSEPNCGTTFRVSLPIGEYEAGQKIEFES